MLSASSIIDPFKVIEKLVGSEIIENLSKVFDEALKDEIYKVLNTDNLIQNFPKLSERFWARIALPLVEFSERVFHNIDVTSWETFKKVEKELATSIAKIIKNSSYNRANDIIYALSVLVDRDLWVFDKICELGLENFIKKLIERDINLALQFLGYTLYLSFAWLSLTVTVIGVAKEYKEENRDLLAMWCREYSKELEDCIDTLDILLDDEVDTPISSSRC